jgi:hypothetical protein
VQRLVTKEPGTAIPAVCSATVRKRRGR